jgi:hypothetical protein
MLTALAAMYSAVVPSGRSTLIQSTVLPSSLATNSMLSSLWLWMRPARGAGAAQCTATPTRCSVFFRLLRSGAHEDDIGRSGAAVASIQVTSGDGLSARPYRARERAGDDLEHLTLPLIFVLTKALAPELWHSRT